MDDTRKQVTAVDNPIKGLTLEQVDAINLALNRIDAMAELVSAFGQSPNPVRTGLTLMHAMDLVQEQVNGIKGILEQDAGRDEVGEASPDS